MLWFPSSGKDRVDYTFTSIKYRVDGEYDETRYPFRSWEMQTEMWKRENRQNLSRKSTPIWNGLPRCAK